MRILRLSEQTRRSVLSEAVSVLKRGGVIAFPTETTYGIGCDPRHAGAVRRIFRIKGRSTRKPLLLVAADRKQAKRVVTVFSQESLRASRLRKIAVRLSRRYWPGPLTLILPVDPHAGLDRRVAPKGAVALRISSSPIVRQLTRAYGFPLIATSANRSGEPDCRSGRAVARAFREQRSTPDLLLDAGRLPRRVPSTVVRVREDGRIEVLRQGSVRIGSLKHAVYGCFPKGILRSAQNDKDLRHAERSEASLPSF